MAQYLEHRYGGGRGPMFSRYTSFNYQPDDRTAVASFWAEVGGPVVARQPGFRYGLVLESTEMPGVIRAFTLWDSESHYESFSTGPDQDLIVNGIRSTTMSTVDRDGLETMSAVSPTPGEVRVIRSTIEPGQIEALRSHWPAARAIVEAAPGCIAAHGFIDAEQMIFLLMVMWRTAEDAEAFRQSDVHNEQFVPGMDQHVSRLDRLRTQPLDQGVTR